MELLFLNVGTPEMMLIALPLMLFIFYSLFHAATNLAIPAAHRMIWGLVILAIPLLGSIAYWVIGRKPAGRSVGK